MKICYVSQTPNIGGGEVSLLTLIEARRDGIEPAAIVYDTGPLVDRLDRAGIPCVVVHRPGKLLTLAMLLRLAATIRRLAPDLVHVNSLDIRIGMAARLLGVPLIGHLRVVFPFTWVDRLFVKMADRVISVSDAARDRFCARHPELLPKFVVVPNAVDASPAPEEEPGATTPGPKPIVGMVCRIDRVKGITVFVEAAALLRQMHPGTGFVHVGSADPSDADSVRYEAEVRGLISERALDDCFILAGFQDSPQDYIRRFAVTAVPSVELNTPHGPRTEGFGRVIVEAMAQHSPVVASRVGGIPEIINDGETGLLVEPDDPQALAEAMSRLLSDDSLRARIVASGFELYRSRYTVARHAEAVAEVYQGVLADH